MPGPSWRRLLFLVFWALWRSEREQGRQDVAGLLTLSLRSRRSGPATITSPPTSSLTILRLQPGCSDSHLVLLTNTPHGNPSCKRRLMHKTATKGFMHKVPLKSTLAAGCRAVSRGHAHLHVPLCNASALPTAHSRRTSGFHGFQRRRLAGTDLRRSRSRRRRSWHRPSCCCRWPFS